jgi:hypothetical protein
VHIGNARFYRYEGWITAVVDDKCSWDRQRLTSRDIGWLVRWLAKNRKFAPEPYETLAAHLARNGAYDRAAKVQQMRRHAIQQQYWDNDDWPAWTRTALYGLLFNYGIGDADSWTRISILVLVLWLAGAAVVRRDASRAHSWPEPGLLFSLDRLLPIIDLNEKCTLETRWVRAYFACHTILGWVIAIFLGAWAADFIG